MKKALVLVTIAFLLLGSVVFADNGVVENSYLVMFKAKPGASDRAAVKALGGSVNSEYSIVNGMSVTLPNANAVNGIKNNPNVLYVEEDQIYSIAADTQPYGIGAVNADLVWGQTTGAGVKVGVLDTGIDYNHPDLDDLYVGGYDYINNDSDPWDDHYHGTHVAGTIAAEMNGSGVVGCAYDVDLYALKVLDAEGYGSTTAILNGVDWAVQNGLDVVNLSLGGGRKSKFEENAYQAAFDAGLLVIVASGNDSATQIGYPAKYDACVAVGAVDASLTIADFSNTGAEQEVVAPGVLVYSSFPMGTGVNSSATVGSTTYPGIGMEFAGTTSGITGTAYDCALGETAGDFPAGVSGNIALISRGNISFADKVTNAMNAGAVAAIIYNNLPGGFAGTLGVEGSWIPAISMSMEDGQAIAAQTPVSMTLVNEPGDFNYLDGTSMACPHAVGVAALIFAANPSLTNQDVRDILSNTATDLGAAGWDSIYGNGIVDAQAAVNAALGM